ncbi:hypothetical protein ACV229_18140 [Burkholderia sp. MR1-5-21]
MTSSNRPDAHSSGRPKSRWGPGKNAALSFAAFAVIFGLFTHVRRDAGGEHANAAHEVSGVIGTAGGTADPSVVAAAPRPVADRVTNTAQAAPPRATVSPVTVVVDPAAAPTTDPVATPTVCVGSNAAQNAPAARHARPRHSPSVTMVDNATHPAPAYASVKRPYGEPHRQLRTHELAGARMHMDIASRHPAIGGTGRMQTASVTHAELDSARALARARSCAVLNQWHCVEQNASRALAMDPGNSESQLLLGQAIRNRPGI